MNTLTVDIRKAEPGDADAIAEVHRTAWQGAYAGIIPYRALTAMINRRGSQWWANAIRRSATILVVEIGGEVAGYTTVGRSRARELQQQGEIYELYLRPEYQGLGFGRRLFSSARRDLAQSGLKSLVIWALSDNDPAVEFYKALGGKAVARSSERFGDKSLEKVAFAWNN